MRLLKNHGKVIRKINQRGGSINHIMDAGNSNVANLKDALSNLVIGKPVKKVSRIKF